ncbi:MAG: UDP-N-acetylmuramate dehydrogenase [Candidatus Omnitrophica bacterium]|nr:UDP-N-acetylmuramate dehydrogenase [Candidatus Omnitrophota bacterium]
MTNDIKKIIRSNVRGKVRYGEPMYRHTSFRIGGPAEIWFEPQDIDDLKKCALTARKNNIPVIPLGNGTNILVRDEGIKGVVINMSSPSLNYIFWSGQKVCVSSSVSLNEFLRFCGDRGLGGLEFLSGIPGSVGGATMTNAASRHYENTVEWHNIGDFVEEIRVMERDGGIKLLNKLEFSFSNKSVSLKDSMILEVKFNLIKKGESDIRRECDNYLLKKKQTQELRIASAGCIFKNPVDLDRSAGALIDECGLKGKSSGGALISPKHANFIVNRGRASASDVMSLIYLAKKSVRNKSGVELSTEIKIV